MPAIGSNLRKKLDAGSPSGGYAALNNRNTKNPRNANCTARRTTVMARTFLFLSFTALLPHSGAALLVRSSPMQFVHGSPVLVQVPLSLNWQSTCRPPLLGATVVPVPVSGAAPVLV